MIMKRRESAICNAVANASFLGQSGDRTSRVDAAEQGCLGLLNSSFGKPVL